SAPTLGGLRRVAFRRGRRATTGSRSSLDHLERLRNRRLPRRAAPGRLAHEPVDLEVNAHARVRFGVRLTDGDVALDARLPEALRQRIFVDARRATTTVRRGGFVEVESGDVGGHPFTMRAHPRSPPRSGGFSHAEPTICLQATIIIARGERM